MRRQAPGGEIEDPRVIDKKQKVLANSNTVLVAASNATRIAIFFTVELDRSIKDNQYLEINK